MANFVAVLDSVESRRRAFVDRVETFVSFVDGLSVNSLEAGYFSVVWAAGPWTPVDYDVQKDRAALILGDAIEGLHSRRWDSTQLQKLWGSSNFSDKLDGFHVGIVYDGSGELTIGADLLGIFPVYYYSSKEVILVGSSPELFRYHPCFDMIFNPEGLMGILLTKGLVDGKTLLNGVKRLAAGHLLKCNSDHQTSEIPQFKLPMSTEYFDMDLPEQVEILDKALEEAVARHVPRDEKCCLMLSGGLDSSLLAAYLERADYEVLAITEGLKTDNEMRCAKKIAETLGLKHSPFHIGYNNFDKYSELNATWNHISEGFTGVGFWRFYKHLREVAPYVITGFSGDSIMGTLVDRSLEYRGRATYDSFIESINKDAFAPKVLRKLLKKDYHSLIPRTLEKIKEIHDSYPGLEFQQTWGFGLNQRIRFHDLSGVWTLSFGAWPILPFADHKILETAGGLPVASLASRKIERELMRVKFPKLAKLNLAGDAMNTIPVAQGFQHKVKQQIYGTTGVWKIEALREMRNLLIILLRGERRYWLRQFKFDSPEWRTVRKKAEPYIHLTTEIFNKKVLKELMPTADSDYLQVLLKMKDNGVNRTSSLKIILGFAFWLQTHFDSMTNYTQSLNQQN
jgi:asparagine synthase (glutamine-hydrolysing)